MVLVYLKDGDCIELRDAFIAEVNGGELVCLDRHGSPVATFEAMKVQTYTSDPFFAMQIREEVCEEDASQQLP